MLLPMATRFHPFGVEHLLMIGLCVLGCVLVAVVGNSLHGSAHEPLLRRAFAVSIPVLTVPLQVLQLLPGDFDLRTSLPLQFCDLSWVLAAYALWTRDATASRLLYYWGLTLVPQAILTPDLVQGFPDPRWVMFWAMHLLTVWAAVHLTFGQGIRPTWRRLPVRGRLHRRLGGVPDGLQRPHRHQLRLPQRQARGGLGAGPPRPLAGPT